MKPASRTSFRIVTTSGSTDAEGAKKRPPARVFVLMFLALCATGAYFGYRKWASTQPLEWSGTVEARTVEVGSRAGGRVKEVLVKEGDRVKAGDRLIVLEPGDLEAQALMAQAQLEQAQAALKKLKAGARPEEIAQAKARADTAEAALSEALHGARWESIKAAKARLEAATVTVEKAKLDADRAKVLFDGGAISRAELDAADANLRAATAQKEVAQQSLNELQNGVRKEQLTQAASRADEAKASAKLVEAGARIEDIESAEATVKAAQGRVDQIKTTLAELTIVAPRDARVETLDLRPGDLVPPNATAAVLLEDDQLYVRIYVPETQVGQIHPGDEVPVYVDSFPNKAFTGHVEHIDMQGQYSPRNLQTADERANQVFAARVSLGAGSDTSGSLRAGMAAIVKVRRRESP